MDGGWKMPEFPSLAWLNVLKDALNADDLFRQTARWFSGNIALKIGDNAYSMAISDGRIDSVKPGNVGARFTLAGDKETWIELMKKGSLVRLFRQGKILIEGDRVCAMQYWKMLWHVTEKTRTIH